MGYHDGMQTRVWGPAAWLFLHCIAHNYDPSRAKVYERFFRALQGVLPCKTCRENYDMIIRGKRGKQYALSPHIFQSRETFAYWLYRVHVKVSKDLYRTCMKRKEACTKPYPETKRAFSKIRNRYESYRAGACKTEEGGCRSANRGLRKQTQIQVSPIPKPSSLDRAGG